MVFLRYVLNNFRLGKDRSAVAAITGIAWNVKIVKVKSPILQSMFVSVSMFQLSEQLTNVWGRWKKWTEHID